MQRGGFLQEQQLCNTFYSVYQMMKYFQLTTSKWDNGSGGGGGRQGQLQTHLTSDQCNWSDSGGGEGEVYHCTDGPGNERC